METDQAKQAIERALKEARMAYRFNAGSYTYAAYLECLKASDAFMRPSWVEQYLDYADDPSPVRCAVPSPA